FKFLWFDGSTVLSTNVLTRNVLAIGIHEITLQLDDTFPLGTKSQTVSLEVISPSAAVRIVLRVLEESGLSQKDRRPLQASLEAASASFQRGQTISAINQLGAFQHQLLAQILPTDPELAANLSSAVQVIIDAVPTR